MLNSTNQEAPPKNCAPLSVFHHSSFSSENQSNFIIIITILNTVICVTAISSNVMVLFTYTKTPSLKTPGYFLIALLSASDLCVAILSQTSYTIFRYAQSKWDVSVMCWSFLVFSVVSWFLWPISFLILTTITLDRYLALRLHLRYKEIVTSSRYGFVLAGITIFCVVVSCLRIIGLGLNLLGRVLFPLMFVLFILNLFSMTKIHRHIHRHSIRIRSHVPDFNMVRYKSSVNTMYYIVGTFLVCYMPFMFTLIPLSFGDNRSLTVFYINIVTETLVMSNGVFNPVIYYWRIREMRHSFQVLMTAFIDSSLLRNICGRNHSMNLQ